MFSKALLTCSLFFVMATSLYSQEINIGAVNDSFEKEYKNSPFPRDLNSNIITNTDIIRNLPQEDSVEQIFVIKFDFYGNRIFSSAKLNSAVAAYTGRNLSLKELYEAANLVTELYQDGGYLSSYAYVPPQVVSQDVVVMNVVEARIGNILVEGASDYKKDFIANHLFLLAPDTVLKTSELERKLLILNSYQDLEVRTTLKAGTKPGTTDIIVHVTDKNPYKFLFSIDNYGSEATSLYRLNASGVISNILTSGDTLALNGSLGIGSLIDAAIGRGEFDLTQLIYIDFDYAFPILYDGVRLGFNFSYSNYTSSVEEFRPIDPNGYSLRYSLYTEYPIVMSYSNLLLVRFAIAGENTRDFYSGITPDAATEDDILKAEATIVGNFYPTYYTGLLYSVAYKGGFGGLLGLTDKNPTSSNMYASGNFNVIDASFTVFQYASRFVRFNLDLDGQFSFNTLLASERYYLGGIYSVRGYPSSYVSGDSGFSGTFETRFNFLSERLQLFAFVDGGMVFNKQTTAFRDSSYMLLSVGGGIKGYPINGFGLSLEYGYPLISETDKPYEFTESSIYFRISYEF